jgi:hydrogenase maturation protease
VTSIPATGRRNGTIVVLALGNPLAGDDGAGPMALALLAARYPEDAAIAFEDGGTAGIGLLPLVEEADSLLILDAVRTGAAPGTVAQFAGEEIAATLRSVWSPHQIGFADTLALARLRDRIPPRLRLVGIEAESLDFGAPLSRAVAAGLPLMVAAAERCLRDWNAVPEEEGLR